jgi:class 3 adenylate cyclase
MPDLSIVDRLSDQPAQASPAPPRDPRPSSLPNLSALIEETSPAEAALKIPPELEKLLSPDLWRKLNSPAPGRGILINALERVRSVLYLISTFLPGNLVQEKMRRPVAGLVNGQMLKGSLLFSDVSGFTALSERLACLGPEGAERLTAIMNQYFSTMLEILSWSGGILLKFAGDATLVYFPEQEGGKHAAWAVRAGMRMLRAMPSFANLSTPTEKVSLKMKVGIASGEFLAASIGTARRMEYAVIGQAVIQTMAAEGSTTAAGQLVADQATLDCLDASFTYKELKPGFHLVESSADQPVDDFEIKAETRRARGSIPWSASPQAILAQIEVAQRQVQALQPYLATELVERIMVSARQRKLESEYRRTTVLFGNFSGPEALLATWGEAGTSRVTSLLSAYFNAMHEVIERYGGIVSRIDPYSKGTKMLILFGAPVAHEDDPQRAISAALAMNVELENLNESWRRKFARYLPGDFSGPLIQHRLGVTYGDTFAGLAGGATRREYTVMGDDVNLAARLMGAAGMGQVLVSEQVHAAVSDYFILTPLSPIRVKGKSKPIPIYQVDGPRDDSLLQRARSRGALVGRQAELAWGRGLFERLHAGQGMVACLLGPAGLGKSHLGDVIIQQAWEQGTAVLLEQCRSYTQEIPFAPWSSMLRKLAGITASDFRPEIHRDKLQRLFKRLDLLDTEQPALLRLAGIRAAPVPAAVEEKPAVPVVDDNGEEDVSAIVALLKQGRQRRRTTGLDVLQQLEEQNISETGQAWQVVEAPSNERERQAIYSALFSLLSRLSAEVPHLIFIEDAHWLDPQSRDFLGWLAGRTGGCRLLILLAQRPEGSSPDPAWNTLSLEPLTLDGTTALVSHLLVTELAQVIFEQSRGNPLFVDEITRWFQRTRNISAGELKSVLQSSDVLQKLVLSDVESLPLEQREIIRRVAVVGMEFRTGEAQALLPDNIDPVSLSNHLRGLVRARLIILVEAGADARYSFQQSLVRDVLYNSLPFEQRRELHGKLAVYLEQPGSQRRAVHARIEAALEGSAVAASGQAAERMGYHHEQAQRWLPAARNLAAAGEEARMAKAASRAIGYFTRALANLDKLTPEEHTPETDALQVRVGLLSGDLSLLNGDFDTAVTQYESVRKFLEKGVQPGSPALVTPLQLACRLALALPGVRRESEALAVPQYAAR